MPEPATIEPSIERAFPQRDWKQWIPALIWIAIICVESTDLLSAEHTGSFLYALLTRFFGSIDFEQFAHWHHYLRKLGHIVGYATLSWLLFRAWRATLPSLGPRLWSLPWARLAFWMTAAVATLDEFHQSFIPSRTGTFRDVILDSTAALCMQFAIFVALRYRNKTVPGS